MMLIRAFPRHETTQWPLSFSSSKNGVQGAVPPAGVKGRCPFRGACGRRSPQRPERCVFAERARHPISRTLPNGNGPGPVSGLRRGTSETLRISG